MHTIDSIYYRLYVSCSCIGFETPGTSSHTDFVTSNAVIFGFCHELRPQGPILWWNRSSEILILWRIASPDPDLWRIASSHVGFVTNDVVRSRFCDELCRHVPILWRIPSSLVTELFFQDIMVEVDQSGFVIPSFFTKCSDEPDAYFVTNSALFSHKMLLFESISTYTTMSCPVLCSKHAWRYVFVTNEVLLSHKIGCFWKCQFCEEIVLHKTKHVNVDRGVLTAKTPICDKIEDASAAKYENEPHTKPRSDHAIRHKNQSRTTCFVTKSGPEDVIRHKTQI